MKFVRKCEVKFEGTTYERDVKYLKADETKHPFDVLARHTAFDGIINF